MKGQTGIFDVQCTTAFRALVMITSADKMIVLEERATVVIL